MSGQFENFKTRLVELTKKLRTQANSAELMGRLRKFEPAKAAEWASGLFQGQDASFYGKIATIVLCTYFLADISAIGIGKLLPEAPFRMPRVEYGLHRVRSLDDYNTIFARNLFNSNGVIPGEDVGNVNVTDMSSGPPVRTSLPLDLIGTMIMDDEQRSIATIADKTSQEVYPVREQDEIPNKIKVLKIETRKVTFLNLSSHRREFVDMPENVETNAPQITLGNRGGGGGITQVGQHSFDISRDEVTHALSDLNNILTQARAVPNFENGQPAGYKLFQIVPGSIYQKLGLVDGDVICGFDGQPANDPAAAFQKLSNLQNTSHLDLCVKRGGQQTTFSYDFK